MSFRNIIQLSTRSNLASTWGSASNLWAFYPKIRSVTSATSLSPVSPVPGLPLWTRGAKTKTVVKARDLPQGVLPPLPPDEVESNPPKSYPPVLQQHLNNVRKFSDCVVLTRVGDFYEMYFDQVEQYAPLVNLKRAKRSTALGDVPMAGFQHTQLERYLKMFVQDLGKQVAISEQIPLAVDKAIVKTGGPMYDRKVTRIITAGTLVDEGFLNAYENNYLLSIHFSNAILPEVEGIGRTKVSEELKKLPTVGLSWVDLSSGDFFTQSSDLSSLPSLVARIGPREIVLEASMESVGQTELQKLLGDGIYSIHYHELLQAPSGVLEWTPMLERAVPEKQHLEFTEDEVAAGNLVLNYIKHKLPDANVQLQPPTRRSDGEYMVIDKQSLRGLEIRSTLRDGAFRGSLLHAVRRTATKSGARLLRERLVSPSMSLSIINNRLDLVQELLAHDSLREDVIALLRRTSDIWRLLQRFSIARGDADDLLNLARTIDIMGRMSTVLHDHLNSRLGKSIIEGPCKKSESAELKFMWDILGRLDLEGPAKLAKAILTAIDEEGLSRRHTVEDEARANSEEKASEVIAADAVDEVGPMLAQRAKLKAVISTNDTSMEDIWIMRRDASSTLARSHGELDKLMEVKNDLASSLREQLRAGTLSLKWSPRYGHFCHIKGKYSQNNLLGLQGVRSLATSKSTRSFYFTDWTHLGVRMEEAKLRIRTEEERVFGKLRDQVIRSLVKLRRNAAVLDELDVGCSSATVAKEGNLIRPLVNQSTSHNIVGGRHPTVDISLMEQGRSFTCNDCSVGNREKIYLITGPNMAGKSTYLRQNALITILAQTGCFVPADLAEIGLVDKIFSRVGSADNLYQDQSTFMVEMLETAEILKQATSRSFVIMDEVGRGTTPEDGLAVAYACLHHLHNVNMSRTLFATHFHALADMTNHLGNLACYCTDVAEDRDGSWTYIHKLRQGVNRQSHALKVARLAGMPEEAITVATLTLAGLQRRTDTKENAGGITAAAATSAG